MIMPEICEVCGLPRELCMCGEIAKEQQKIVIYTTRRRYRKLMTIVEGINQKDIDVKSLAKQLKERCACGGTAKEGKIELQGEQRDKVKKTLISSGFDEESIEVK